MRLAKRIARDVALKGDTPRVSEPPFPRPNFVKVLVKPSHLYVFFDLTVCPTRASLDVLRERGWHDGEC